MYEDTSKHARITTVKVFRVALGSNLFVRRQLNYAST